MTNVLSNLKKLKSSADFDTAITDLEAELSEATADVDELESQREDLIFSGGNLAKLEADIAAAEGKAKTLTIAMEGAKRRRDEAAEAERMAELEKVADGGQKLKTKLNAELIEFHKLASALAIHAGEITKLREDIASANKTTFRAGRGDLKVKDPVYDLGKRLERRVHDPLRGMLIQGYWPADGHGPALAALKK